MATKKPMTPSEAGKILQNPRSREADETKAAKVLNDQKKKLAKAKKK